jgi:hypothetical protein
VPFIAVLLSWGLGELTFYVVQFLGAGSVGFNEDKSVEVVYMGYYCGGLCGSGGVKFMKKKDGHWLHMSERECFEWAS